MAEEFYTPNESAPLPNEFQSQYVAEAKDHKDEFAEEPANKAEPKKESLMLKMKKMAYLVAASASVVTIGFAAADSSTAPSATPSTAPSAPPSAVVEIADKEFPTLPNLEPNGYVPGYGVLDEEYLILVDRNGNGKTNIWLWVGAKRVSGEGLPLLIESALAVDGARYDRDENTLYLDNYKNPNIGINANLMGNGFTINVSGDCELYNIISWGFFYGGSVTITGNGKLTLYSQPNAELRYDNPNISIEAEDSYSALMIDSQVTLDLKNQITPIQVFDTRLDKGVYFLEPSKMQGGIRGIYGEIIPGRAHSDYIETVHEGMDADDIYSIVWPEDPEGAKDLRGVIFSK